jgi:hypothetical protein
LWLELFQFLSNSFAGPIILDAHLGHGVGIGPDDVFGQSHSIFLQVLDVIAKALPVRLPLPLRTLQNLHKLLKILLVSPDCLSNSIEFLLDLVRLFALHEIEVGRVRIQLKAI